MYIEVKGDGNREDLERALRIFTRMIKKADIINEVKRREFYVKKSKRKILKQQEALRKRIREQKKIEKRKEKDW
jgi:ribosomal protein S21